MKWAGWGVLGVAVVGAGLSALLPSTYGARAAAELGVGLAVGSSVVALLLRRWGLAQSLQATLLAIGALFFLRLVLVVVGLFEVKAHGGSLVAYVAGFFGSYLVLQWIELSDALARNRGET